MGVSNAAVWLTCSPTSVVNGAILVQPHAGFHLLNGKFYSITKIKRKKKSIKFQLWIMTINCYIDDVALEEV